MVVILFSQPNKLIYNHPTYHQFTPMKYFIIFLLFVTSNLSAQHLLEGKVLDENHKELVGATVVLLESKDSAMVAFSISDNDGIFHLEEVDEGSYILQLSFVSYRTAYNNIDVKNGDKAIDLGEFKLDPTSEILQEVTVKAEHIPMGVIGDTISYNAAAFQVRPGASVEDLLKKLPGIEVQRDGSIKAMGEDVENVLVDGKEFFGSDPKIATKNLEAEAVDKVQVFDKMSEIAEFTGIDDGEDEKTINLKLKEEYKKGGFGNLHVAAGSKERYSSKINYNRFSPQMQASIIIGANNINEQAFSFNEYIQFMGGLGNAISSNNGAFNFGEFGRDRSPQGLTDNISSGLNFNYDWSNKVQLTSYYFFNKRNKKLNTNTVSKQFTNTSNFDTDDELESTNINQNHRLHAKLDFKPSPFSQLIWKNTFSGIIGSEDRIATTLFNEAGIESGRTTSDVLIDNDQVGYDGQLQYRKKYKKKGRNWINTFSYQIGTNNEENNILNEYFFDESLSLLDQNQLYSYKKNTAKLSSAFTEPLGKQFYLGAKYEFERESEHPEKLFFDLVNSESIINKNLSAGYLKKVFAHNGSISIRKNAKRYKFNSAIGFQHSSITGNIEQQINTPIEQTLDNKTLYFTPYMSFEYDLSKEKSIDLSYRTSVNLPQLSQLAPLPDNNNPNLLVLGNPMLSPEFMHNIGLGFRSLDHFNFKNLFLNVNFSMIENQIINTVAIDDQFIKTLRPENSNGYKQVSSFFSYSSPIRSLKLKYHVSTNFSLASYETFLNDSESDVTESNINLNLSVDNRSKDHIDIATGIRMDYNVRKYSLNSDFNQKFFNYKLFIDGLFYPGKEWTLSAKYDYVSYSGEFFSDKQQFNLLTCSIRKSFKEGKFSIELSAYDLLNENLGIQRSGGVNSLYETRYNTLSRYIMVGFKMKLGKKNRKDKISFG